MDPFLGDPEDEQRKLVNDIEDFLEATALGQKTLRVEMPDFITAREPGTLIRQTAGALLRAARAYTAERRLDEAHRLPFYRRIQSLLIMMGPSSREVLLILNAWGSHLPVEAESIVELARQIIEAAFREADRPDEELRLPTAAH